MDETWSLPSGDLSSGEDEGYRNDLVKCGTRCTEGLDQGLQNVHQHSEG